MVSLYKPFNIYILEYMFLKTYIFHLSHSKKPDISCFVKECEKKKNQTLYFKFQKLKTLKALRAQAIDLREQNESSKGLSLGEYKLNPLLEARGGGGRGT